MAFEWYVARVKRHQAGLVENHIRRWGHEAYNPRIVVLKRGTAEWEDLFPGYLFCRVDTDIDDCWPRLLWTPGLSYFLPPQHHPSPLGEEAVEEIRHRVQAWNQGAYVRVFRSGDRVRVKSGPLMGLDALFKRYLPARDRCEVFLNWLGRRLLTTIDPSDLDIATRSEHSPGWVAGYGRIARADVGPV
jgi:transcription antitermination factor NusG